MKEEVKTVADKQDGFRDLIADLKERQSKILQNFAIAAIIATAVMTLVLKIVADHLFPNSPVAVAAPAAPPSVIPPLGAPSQAPPSLPSAPADRKAAPSPGAAN